MTLHSSAPANFFGLKFQKCFRVLMQGAPQKVIGLEPGNICEEMQIIDGIVIQPSLSCHVEDETEPDVKME